MVQTVTAGSEPAGAGSSAVDREADRVDDLHSGADRDGQHRKSESAQQPEIGSQIEQDSRIEKAVREAKSRGGGPDAPEEGLNQDG